MLHTGVEKRIRFAPAPSGLCSRQMDNAIVKSRPVPGVVRGVMLPDN